MSEPRSPNLKAQAPGPGGPSARQRVAAMPAGDRTGRVLGQLRVTAPLTRMISGCDSDLATAAAAGLAAAPGLAFSEGSLSPVDVPCRP